MHRRSSYSLTQAFTRGNDITYAAATSVSKATAAKLEEADMYTSVGHPMCLIALPLIVIDATPGSVGDPVADDLEADGVPVYRFEFTGPSRRGLLDRMIMGVENAELTLPDEPLCINEFDGSFGLTPPTMWISVIGMLSYARTFSCTCSGDST